MGRSSTDDAALYAFARSLTERDIAIVCWVGRLGVLTTAQVTEAFFDGRKRACERLTRLHDAGLVERFRPFVPTGSAPHHYVVGRRGAVVWAAHDPAHPDHEEPQRAARRWRPGTAAAVAGRAGLAHQLGVNGVCTALLGHARREPGAALLRWRTEGSFRSRATVLGTSPQVRPDAFLVWREHGLTVTGFIEYDRGTERPASRLVEKLPGYQGTERERSRASWLLFVFESPRREDNARRALATHADDLPIATATLAGGEDPAGMVWRPLRGGLYRLADLTTLPLPRGSRDRIGDGSRSWSDTLLSGLDLDAEPPPDNPSEPVIPARAPW